jgi:hypothetical protein
MKPSDLLLAGLGLVATPVDALLRFGCARSSIQRLDPLVNPGLNPSPHLHQIVGGVSLCCGSSRPPSTICKTLLTLLQNSFNMTMDASKHDLASLSTCTSCQFTGQ